MTATSAAVRPMQALAQGVLRRLASRQLPDGNLRDPVTDEPLPSAHYGVTLFAAACAIAETPDLREAAVRAARYYLAIPAPARGAHELNNLGLLCLYEHWDRVGGPAALRSELAAYLRRMPFASTRGKANNNWHAMRAVCLARRGRLLGCEEDGGAARACLRSYVLPLQGADGLFADYPAPGQPGDRMTPLTYHAKFCAMLAMLLPEIPHDRAAALSALTRGTGALARLCAPDGQALYFGRSCNSVYGHTAALYALAHAQVIGAVAPEDRDVVERSVDRIAQFVSGMADADGGLRPYPTTLDIDHRGWDDYVHRVDYSAFAAFLLLQTPAEPAGTARAGYGGAVARPSRTSLNGHAGIGDATGGPAGFDARDAGLLVRERDGVFAAFSTRGQLHTGSYMFADARYAGMQPLALQCGGVTIVPPPPHDAAAPVDPTWIGFMPVAMLAGEPFAVRTYDEVRVRDNGYIAISGRGTPVALRLDPRRRLVARATRRGRSGTAFLRWAARVSRGLGVPAPPAYVTVPAPGMRVTRSVILLPSIRCLALVERIDGDCDAGWTSIRVPGPGVAAGGGWWSIDGAPETRLWVAEPAGPAEFREVFTSNGPAWVFRTPVVRGRPHVAALCFGTQVSLRAEVDGSNRPGVIVGAGAHRLAVDLEALEVAVQ